MSRRSNKRGRRESEPGQKGAPVWMVTYGDLMSLLLVFFVMIVAFSTIEIEKFKAVMGSVRGALYHWSPSAHGNTMISSPVLNITDEIMEDVAEEIASAIKEADLDEFIEVYQVNGGVKVVFTDPVLFDVGSDELKPMAKPILHLVMTISRRINVNELLVEGHTDNTPIKTARFPSNWELSSARAIGVLKFFLSLSYPPEKLAAVGYGEYRPRVPLPITASWDEKAPNRRVEIFMDFRNLTEFGFAQSGIEDFRGWED